MTHLGDRACLLVDGELDAGAHDEAMAHLGACGQCRRQVTAYRHLKAWLAQTPAEPGPALMARLLPIPERQPLLCDAFMGEAFARGPSSNRSRARSVVAAGFAASVVVGLGAAATGSSSVAAGGAATSQSGTSTVNSVPIGVTLSRSGNPAAVSVVYRRP